MIKNRIQLLEQKERKKERKKQTNKQTKKQTNKQTNKQKAGRLRWISSHSEWYILCGMYTVQV